MNRHIGRIILILLILICLLMTLASATPPVSRDALVHHLTLPRLYLEEGGIVELPHLFFSYFPANLHLLYMFFLYLGNDILPKYCHLFFGLLTAAFLYRLTRRHTNQYCALFAALLFLSTPAVFRLCISAYVDLGLTFFTFGSLILLLSWQESGYKYRYLAGAAISCGAAMGIKYNGLIVCFILFCLVALLRNKAQPPAEDSTAGTVKSVFLFILLAFLFFSPWMIRNWIWTQNPVYPLYTSVFSKFASNNPNYPPGYSEFPERRAGVVNKEKIGRFARRRQIFGETPLELATLPIRIFFQGKDHDARYFDGRLSFLYLLLPLLLLPGIRRSSEFHYFFQKNHLLKAGSPRADAIFLCACFSVLFFLFTLFSSVIRVRYLVPMLPPLSFLAAAGLYSGLIRLRSFHMVHSRFRKNSKEGDFLWPKSTRASRAFLAFLLSFICLSGIGMNFQYAIGQTLRLSPLSYLSGKLSRDEYIARFQPAYPVFQYINTRLPQDARILFLFMGRRGYYCHRDYRLDFDETSSLLLGVLRSTENADQVANLFLRRGISHLLFNERLLIEWARESLPPLKQTILERLLNSRTIPLARQNGYVLLAIDDPVKTDQ